MHIITSAPALDHERDPAWSYLYIWTCSVVYWLRDADAEVSNKALLPTLVKDFKTALPLAEAFCKSYRIPIRALRTYTAGMLTGAPTDAMTEALYAHLGDLRTAAPALQKSGITDLQLEALKKLRLWHIKENPSNLEWLRKNLGALHMPTTLSGALRTEVESQAPYLSQIRVLVKKLTGKAALHIPMELKPEIRERFPEDMKEYNALQRTVDGIYKTALREYVRSKGGPQDIKAVIRALDKQGIQHKLHPEFVGLVGEDGTLYTPDGSPLASVPDHNTRIRINPDYTPEKDLESGRNNNWYAHVTLPTTDAKGNPNTQYLYTLQKLGVNKSSKFGVVEQILAKEDQIVRRWRKDLVPRVDDDLQVLAAICEILYQTCARVGSVGNENKKGATYGITTLTVGHLKRRGTDRILDYVGKDSVNLKHVIKSGNKIQNEVIKVLDSLCGNEKKGTLKRRNELLFEWDGTKYTAAKVNTYFKGICGIPGAHAHNIRHLRGTRIAITELDKASATLAAKSKLSQTQVDQAFRLAITAVGSALGHVRGVGADEKATWQTAAKNYVSPDVMRGFYTQFQDQGIRLPKFLQAAE